MKFPHLPVRPHLMLLLIISSLADVANAQAPSAIPVDVQAAMRTLRPEAFHAHMAFLADDLLEGRGTATRGHELAARYVAAQFEAMGLKPAGIDGTYYQNVPLSEITVNPRKCELSFDENGEPMQYKWGDGFIMHGNASNADSSVEAPVVFVGYGVKSPDGRYDDYSGSNVKGKIVALLDGAPAALSSEMRAHVASTREKMRTATNLGAVGMIVLRPPQAEAILPWDRWIVSTSFPSMRWLTPEGQPNDAFPQIRARARLSQPASARLFLHATKSWEDVLRDAASSKPQSFPLPLLAHLREVSPHRQVTSPNVMAVLPGSDSQLSREYVIYSAHADHLGIGTPINGDSIYNGASDDASGVAALLLIAQAYESLAQPPARSILFLATTGEEAGLLGSDYFAHYPTVPIHDIVADINMDTASIFYTFDDIVALGANDSTLDSVVARSAGKLNLRLIPDPFPGDFGFVRNDQYSFVRQHVPAILITEGVTARNPGVDARKLNDDYGTNRYHAPSDDMSQPMDLNAAVEFMQVDFLVGYDIAQTPERPTWKAGDFFGESNLSSPTVTPIHP